MGDPWALEQIIDSLLANALRVSPPSSSITLHRIPGGELYIVDQGPGMSEADRERAFDRFWRASDSPHDGTGLGLPIVRHLVDASGGAITLHPAPGTGLDVAVRLRPATGQRSHGGRPPRSTSASVQERDDRTVQKVSYGGQVRPAVGVTVPRRSTLGGGAGADLDPRASTRRVVRAGAGRKGLQPQPHRVVPWQRLPVGRGAARRAVGVSAGQGGVNFL
ncbi:sensor histidine kinase [Streptomyces sp. NPDC059629]|uniref:sensor histidine kinase n=1 Tax=Streptomyces sp. NPDC059629 TaxID=3346889 RepID=UPI0036AB524D